MSGIGRQRVVSAVGGAALLALAACDLGAPPTTYTTPGGPSSSGDIDGDGDLDLVTTTERELGVLLNDGSGSFTVTTSLHPNYVDQTGSDFTLTDRTTSVVLGDLNGDGRADLVVRHDRTLSQPSGTTNDAKVDVRLADGSGGFGPATTVSSITQAQGQIGPTWVTPADVTGDGQVDLVLSAGFPQGGQSGYRVLPGNGAAGFGAAVTSAYPASMLSQDAIARDVNGDGRADLVLTGTCVQGTWGNEDFAVGCVKIGYGGATGAISGWTTLQATDHAVDTLDGADLGDVDEDGDLDLVAGNGGTDFDTGGPAHTFSIFPGDGAGGFGPEVSVQAIEQTDDVQLADFDGDSHLDLLTHTTWHGGLGRLVFGAGAAGLSDDIHLGVGGLIGDFDGDGRPDLANGATDSTSIFLNRWDDRPD